MKMGKLKSIAAGAAKRPLRLLGQKLSPLARLRDEYGYLLWAALIPAALMLLIYIAHGTYPFGDESVLVLDLTGQYVYFYEGLRDILSGEASIFYSFSRALGGEFLGMYDYYVASPFAMIIKLFPEHRMLEALLTLFLLKTALSGLTMGFYLHKHSIDKGRKLPVIIFSVLYALTSYAVVQQHNSMWIDALLWLPIVTYAIEELIKRGKFRLYVFTLAITLISNFYIGYMVCIYTAAYFFFYYFAHNRNNENNPTGEKHHFVRSLTRIACWSALAIGIAALIILSARYSLAFGKDEFSNPNWSITQKFDLFELGYKFLPSSYDTVRPAGLPFVYCGVLTLILVPAYFLCKKFSVRERVGSAFFILFFIASFMTSVIDLVWHGFQTPNWLNYRYSFMLCFFLLTLAFRAFERVEFVSRKALLGVTAFLGLFVLLAQELQDQLFVDIREVYSGSKEFTFHEFGTTWLALGCLFAYFLIICLMGLCKNRKKETLTVVLAVIVCAEVFTSGLMDMISFDHDVIYSGYSKYNTFNATYRPIVDAVEEYDDGFYRMEKTFHLKSNDNFGLGIKGVSNSTSTLNRSTLEFLASMGLYAKSHDAKYRGGTPVANSLLGIKYLISDDDIDLSDNYGDPVLTPEDYDFESYGYDITYPEDVSKFTGGKNSVYKADNLLVYKNEHALSFAYAADDAWMTYDHNDYANPFDQMNAMVSTLLGEEETLEIFTPVVQNGGAELDNAKKEFISADRTSAGIAEYKYSPEDPEKDATLTFNLTVPTDTPIYYYVSPKSTGYSRNFTVKVNNKTLKDDAGDDEFEANSTYHTVSLGTFSKEDVKIELTIEEDGSYTDLYMREEAVTVYSFNREVYEDAIVRLAETQLEIDNTSTDDRITGQISTDKERQLIFTSIPYDAGWNITVDGKPVETLEANGSLVAFYIDGEGDHEVELEYMPRIIKLGIIVSAVCAILYILLLILYRPLQRVPILRHAMRIQREDLPAIPAPEDSLGFDEGDIGAPPSDADEDDESDPDAFENDEETHE